MNTKISIHLTLLSVFITLVFYSCKEETSEKITIATAANMQYAVKEIAVTFTKETGIECQTIIGSSGKLTAQIIEGAPFDVFISADTKYPDNLYSKGFTTTKPEIYGYGKLILWTLKDDIIPSIEILFTNKIQHIASANPKTAPYGIATEEVLTYYSIFKEVKPKLVFGESVAQTNQFITSKVAEIGFTAKSVVLTPVLKEKGSYIEIDQAAYTPIAQSAVILKNASENYINSEKFFNFLYSKKGKEILEKHGYTVNYNE